MNWRFGYSLGKSGFESELYGAASAAADCFKALLPFFIFAALRSKTWSQALGGAMLFTVCFSYSLSSSLGFAALNRADTTGSRVLLAETHEDLRAELDRTRNALKGLPEHRPAGSVTGEIEALKQSPSWVSSEGCTNATIAKSMEYCGKYFKLKAELAAAQQAEKLDAQADQLRAKLGKLDAVAVSQTSDPQSQVLAKLSGASTEQVQTALTVLIALLVELGASLGFYTAFAYWRVFDVKGLPMPEAPAAAAFAPQPLRVVPAETEDEEETPLLAAAEPRTDVELYFDERVGKDASSSVTALALYDDYCQWCEAKAKQPLGLPIFTRKFSELGVQKAKVAGRIRYLGVRLLFAEDDDARRELSAVS
jgi:hypothetical protein